MAYNISRHRFNFSSGAVQELVWVCSLGPEGVQVHQEAAGIGAQNIRMFTGLSRLK